MTYARQTVDFTVDCSGTIEATGQMTDYGVPSSPRWMEYEPKDWGDYTVDIAGVTVKLVDLPEELRNALWDSAMDGIDDNAWEQDEPEDW